MLSAGPDSAGSIFNGYSSARNGYQRNVPRLAAQRYIILMSYGTGQAKYKCAQCEMAEDQCECDKYCCLCQTVLEVRICQDGLMYCEPCRTACDYKTSS